MEHWQLALIILAAVLVGASIPVFVMLFSALSRAGKEIADIGKRLKPTLSHIEVISERVETLSRGLEGGQKNIADLLTAMGDSAHTLERNMKIINITSAIVASLGPAVAAFIKTMRQSNGSNGSDDPREPATPEQGD